MDYRKREGGEEDVNATSTQRIIPIACWKKSNMKQKRDFYDVEGSSIGKGKYVRALTDREEQDEFLYQDQEHAIRQGCLMAGKRFPRWSFIVVSDRKSEFVSDSQTAVCASLVAGSAMFRERLNSNFFFFFRQKYEILHVSGSASRACACN